MHHKYQRLTLQISLKNELTENKLQHGMGNFYEHISNSKYVSPVSYA